MEISGDKIDNFKEFCGINDEEVAVRYLRHCHGDLQAALHLYFQTGGVLEDEGVNEEMNDADELVYARNGQARLLRRHAEASPSHSSDSNDRISQPQWSVVQPWRQFVVALITLPFNFVFTTIFDILKFFCDIVFGERTPSITNYREDVAKFRQAVRENFPNIRVVFFNGTYEEASFRTATAVV
ncbi:hypothetical protein OESDEN_07240 [Oesophagostomum dentatum]|uniref:Uncharacterized protein n=1 Tax=Oesophagostomum dentatum TaxID=61180 RepID=A0A0B1TBY3_OESDE|nr:hypothetical protein OESDEN_07240 [Oesophagostomum dentatum]